MDSQIKGKRILVTGAGGFIGSHLALKLYNSHNYVRVVDLKWTSPIKERYYSDKLTLDLRNKTDCIKATKGIDYVFNLAANVGGVRYITKVGAKILYDNQNINLNMLDASVKNKIKRFFFSSSACIYPLSLQKHSQLRPLRESDAMPADPDSFYGWEKLIAEKECEAYERDFGLEVRIARFHSIYGEGCEYDDLKGKAPAALCRKVIRAKNGGTISIWGDGEQTRSFLYISDCINGILALVQSDYNKPVNLGTDKMVSINELADIVIKISGKRITKTYDHSKPVGVMGRNADLSLAQSKLKWEPKIPIGVGMDKLYAWVTEDLKQSANLVK